MIPGAKPPGPDAAAEALFNASAAVSLIPGAHIGRKGIFKRKREIKPPAGVKDRSVSMYRVNLVKIGNKQDHALQVGKMNAPPRKERKYDCITGYIQGNTSDSIFHKAMTCGKENCPTCGADYSITHERRILRCHHYVAQMDKVGYMVITFPEMYWQRMKDKRVLSDIRNYVRRKLKRGDNFTVTATDYSKSTRGKKVKRTFKSKKISRGLIRWHWCGEDAITWKPHLNILMESAYIEDWQLTQIKKDVAAWCMAYFAPRLAPGYDDRPATGNVNYGYVSAKTERGRGKIKHWLNYVTRSTAKKTKDRSITDTIYKYKNTGYFGQFERRPKKGSAAAEILAGKDPETGEKIIWTERIRPAQFNVRYREESIYMQAGVWCYVKKLMTHDRILFPDDPVEYMDN